MSPIPRLALFCASLARPLPARPRQEEAHHVRHTRLHQVQATGYRVTGYFLYWLSLNKDKDFIRKFNRTAVEIDPWSWDAAMKKILGDKPENTTDALWDEYQKAIGDK